VLIVLVYGCQRPSGKAGKGKAGGSRAGGSGGGGGESARGESASGGAASRAASGAASSGAPAQVGGAVNYGVLTVRLPENYDAFSNLLIHMIPGGFNRRAAHAEQVLPQRRVVQELE
jgi:hypothetical protein